MRRTLALLALLLAATAAHAQHAVSGGVTDAETGEALAGANIAVLGPDGAVVGGTSTNADGQFTLRLAALPADLAVRFIGYETARFRITAGTPSALAVALRPHVGALGTVTVTPGEDPASALMRRVIARTRAQRAAVGPYAVTAYSRTTILAPDGAIKGILEGTSDAYWSRESGWREVVQAARRTENLGGGTGSATAIADGLLDLLAPDVEISGHRLVGPTHPDALDTYHAEITGTDALDGELVVIVALRPRRATASAFVGTLHVLFRTADVLAVDLQPGPSFLFPPPVKVAGARFRQQYVPVAADSSLWLPADLRSEIGIGFEVDALLYAEPFRVERAAQFSGYRLGVRAPDSLLAGPTVRRAASPDSSRLSAPGVAPALTTAEAAAYAAGDSLGALQDILVFRGPFAGIARRSIRVSAGGGADASAARPAIGFSGAPQAQINPAEAVRVGLALALRAGPLLLSPRAAFRSADRGVSLGADASLRAARLGRNGALSLVGSVSDGVARRIAPGSPSLALGFLGGPGGYYASRQASGGVRAQLSGLGTVRQGSFFQFEAAADLSLQVIAETASRYRPAHPDAFLPGPDTLALTARSLRLDASLGTLDVPLGLLPRRAIRAMVEWAPASFGGPAFWRADASVDGRIPTLARRRALPAALDVRLAGGVSGGDLPAFRQFALEGTAGTGGVGTGAFGALRTRTTAPDAGDRYALLAWEHSFRTLAFEALGLRALTDRAYNLIVHGAHARTWDGPDAATRWHHEVGLALSGLVGGLRIDLTQRLDAPATTIGLGIGRVF